ncbi:MAG: hypothetical protein AB1627_06355 [Chloroflexota bacterium]
MSMNLAAVPVAALTIVGLLLALLGVFGGGLGVIGLGVTSLVAAALTGALATRRA